MAEVLKKQRKSNFSPEEVDVLVRTVGKNYETLYGEFSKRAIFRGDRYQAWLDVTKEVNLVSLEKRTLQEVKNKWKKCQHLLYRSDDSELLTGPDENALAKSDDANVWELLTSIEEDEEMGKMRNKTNIRPTPNLLQRRQCTIYDPEFKRVVALYAEQNGTVKAKCKFSVSESNIRRWRRIVRNSDIVNILEKPPEKPVAIAPRNVRGRKRNSVKTGALKNVPSSALDSMPLQQRLQAPTPSTSEQEPVLHSQPLSPTKLKVTRHSKPAQAAPSPVPLLPPPIEEVCLKWNSHHSNMQNSFPNLLLREQYVDATLVAEGQTLKCHRVILSSCSTYFEEVLASISPYQHPVLFMKDIPFWVLKSLCDYMYAGEVHILQNRLQELLAAADNLKIKGLTESPINNPAVKTEPQEFIKEEKRDEEETKKKEDAKKKDERDTKKKEDVRKKEEREVKKKDEVKKKEEVKETKDKKRNQVTPPPEMPVLKSAKLSKATQLTEMPNLLKNAKGSRVGVSRRSAKRSVETVTKELSGIFLDPLDLLQPVYEEVTKEPPITSTPKDIKPVPVRRSFPKKFKKRKITDDREDSPQPVLSRKGTRSRPNRKVPKFYHSNFDNSTIVREPHTDQADPLMQLQEIKSEPLYLEEDTIEIEDNLVGFSEQELTIEEEEILGDYDSPIVNFTGPRPVIETVDSKTENTLKIVNVDDIRAATGPKSVYPLEEDPLHVQNVIESNENSLGFRISEVVTEKEDLGFQITSVVSEKEEETGSCSDLTFQILHVQSQAEENVPVGKENEEDISNCCDGRFQGIDVNSALNRGKTTGYSDNEVVSSQLEGNAAGTNEKDEETLDNPEESVEDTFACTGFPSSEVQGILDAKADDSGTVEDNKAEELEDNTCSRMEIDGVEEICPENRAVAIEAQPEEETKLNASPDGSAQQENEPDRESPSRPEIGSATPKPTCNNRLENTEKNAETTETPPETTETPPETTETPPETTETPPETIENPPETAETPPKPRPDWPETEPHPEDLDFLSSGDDLQGFSPDEPGFHVARLAIEQIARNEKRRLDGQGSSEGEPNSNDLETIVNDLTKIVGGSGAGEGPEEGQDSSAVAEALESLLND